MRPLCDYESARSPRAGVKFRAALVAFRTIDSSVGLSLTPPNFLSAPQRRGCPPFYTTYLRLPKMPPKGKKDQNKGKGGEEEREDPLQAVVCTLSHVHQSSANILDSCGPLRDAFQPFHT